MRQGRLTSIATAVRVNRPYHRPVVTAKTRAISGPGHACFQRLPLPILAMI
jgi:hypothetical protein